MRTSAAMAPLFVANTGFKSISAISGKSAIELRHVLDHARERVAVDRVGAAHAFQDFRRGDAVEHRQRIVARRRRQPERDVLQDLDQNAARARTPPACRTTDR